MNRLKVDLEVVVFHAIDEAHHPLEEFSRACFDGYPLNIVDALKLESGNLFVDRKSVV